MSDFEKITKMFQTIQDDLAEQYGNSHPFFESDGEMIWLIDSEILIEFDEHGKFTTVEFPVEVADE